MAVNDGSFLGWPFQNFAMELRGTQTPLGTSRNAMVLPRNKFTFLVEFQINDEAIRPGWSQTDLKRHLQNGRLYVPLKRVDHPKVNFKTETLRSYNKFVKVLTATEFQPFRMSFQDDNSSMAMALWKEYLAFYRYAGDVGRGIVVRQNRRLNQNNEFRAQNDLTGTEVRSDMNIHPSVGMTLRPYYKRHFFDRITIYDLGSEPDSVNVYRYVHPVITGIDHAGLDYFDRTTHVDVTFNLEYENYYFAVGQNNTVLSPIILEILGIASPVPTGHVEGHANMVAPDKSLLTSPTSLTGNPVDTSVPRTGIIRNGPLNPITGFNPQSPLNTPTVAPSASVAEFFSPSMEVTQQRIDNLNRLMQDPNFTEAQKSEFQDIIQQQQNHLDNLRNLDAERAQRAITQATQRAEEATKRLLVEQH